MNICIKARQHKTYFFKTLDSWVIFSPGKITGIPGRYSNIITAEVSSINLLMVPSLLYLLVTFKMLDVDLIAAQLRH